MNSDTQILFLQKQWKQLFENANREGETQVSPFFSLWNELESTTSLSFAELFKKVWGNGAVFTPTTYLADRFLNDDIGYADYVLYYAIKYGNKELVEWFINKGIGKIEDENDRFHPLLHPEDEVSEALLQAISMNNYEYVKLLTENGFRDETAVDVAIETEERTKEDHGVVSYLLNNNYKLDFSANMVVRYSRTFLKYRGELKNFKEWVKVYELMDNDEFFKLLYAIHKEEFHWVSEAFSEAVTNIQPDEMQKWIDLIKTRGNDWTFKDHSIKHAFVTLCRKKNRKCVEMLINAFDLRKSYQDGINAAKHNGDMEIEGWLADQKAFCE